MSRILEPNTPFQEGIRKLVDRGDSVPDGWQTAYTEFVFLDTYWPDFDQSVLETAIAEFRARERRFGGLSKRSSA